MPAEGMSISELAADTEFGFIDGSLATGRRFSPQLIANREERTMLRAIRDELRHAESFSFSVAFVTPNAIALLKQDLVEFRGRGVIITSDYLGFNSPRAFRELQALEEMGIETCLHQSVAFHPKGYIFKSRDHSTILLGSSNLTGRALVENYELNLRVTAAQDSDLVRQINQVIQDQLKESIPISDGWISDYSASYTAATRGASRSRGVLGTQLEARQPSVDITRFLIEEGITGAEVTTRNEGRKRDVFPRSTDSPVEHVVANQMQEEALKPLRELREFGETRAIVISATGTGKTILSALDVRDAAPARVLFIVHREQILDRAMRAYQHVLGEGPESFGKLAGGLRQLDRKFVFATIQTLSKPDVLQSIAPEEFDYVLVDEAHRAGAQSYREVMGHLTPRFLLGMTATPERMDGFDLFKLFDYNVAYEIRLGRALEAGMLSPFHYYGVADVEIEGGGGSSPPTDLARLVSSLRVEHVLKALKTYGQAGLAPKGLIFCSRVDEAHSLSEALNRSTLNGRPLKTVALSGSDSVESRELAVGDLEAGRIDYILTVDVFNEGVDIPSLNQVVMLRQTQSAIVFVQQLGRGLRKDHGKDYLVVIDFIGNYANNYMIPIALFGDDSLNKESLRKNLIAAEEAGVLPGLSSVRFEKIARERVLNAITASKLDSIPNLRASVDTLRNRLGRYPRLLDFVRFESVDPTVLATKRNNYPKFLEEVFKEPSGMSADQLSFLTFLSHEVLGAKRLHEALMLKHLIDRVRLQKSEIAAIFAEAGAPCDDEAVASCLRSFGSTFYTSNEVAGYGLPAVKVVEDSVSLQAHVHRWLVESAPFRDAVQDIVQTTCAYVPIHYDVSKMLTPGRQYSRKDACRLLGWERNVSSVIYGYKVDMPTSSCPIFVTYHKGDHVSASTAYGDEFLDRSTMLWYSKSNRTLASNDVKAITSHSVTPYLFAKKDDSDGGNFYFLGTAKPENSQETTMRDDRGKSLPVVRMLMKLDEPMESTVYDYFHPVVTD